MFFFRCKPKLKLRIINQNSVSVLQTPEPDLSTEHDIGRGLSFLLHKKTHTDFCTRGVTVLMLLIIIIKVS